MGREARDVSLTNSQKEKLGEHTDFRSQDSETVAAFFFFCWDVLFHFALFLMINKLSLCFQDNHSTLPQTCQSGSWWYGTSST